MNYAEQYGVDESGKEHAVFRNPEAIERGCLVDREDPDVNSIYQNFK